MTVRVSVSMVGARRLAAVRRQIPIGAVGSAWRPALDQVWTFLRDRPGLRTDGHNIFLYHRQTANDALITADFGVEVTRSFETSGEVHMTETPAGEVATAIHVGGYDRLGETHRAVTAWAEAHRRTLAGQYWEIYGDWSDDPSALETTILYLLK